MKYKNIELFYSKNHQLLLENNGRRSLRPTKSYTKDIIACFDKFKEIYLSSEQKSFTKDEMKRLLQVKDDTALQNIRSMQDFAFLTGSTDGCDEDEKNKTPQTDGSDEEELKFTPLFQQVVKSDVKFGVYILERLSKLQTIDNFTPYLNFLICTLREAGEYGEAISFGPISNNDYKSKVTDPKTRQELRSRIFDIYGYSGRIVPGHTAYNDDYIPNISYMSLGTLEKLGLIKQNEDRNTYGLTSYSLTYPGEHLLKELDENIGQTDTSQKSVPDTMNLRGSMDASIFKTCPKFAQYLVAIRTKPFVLLAGISGTGKSRIVRELAFKSCPKELQDKDGTTPGNYLMVEVKPNWHDSSELLGYYSNISKKYKITPFVKFLVKAKQYPNVPFFVCLDEMNLAPVEQYFAEFLSVLETRRKTTEGCIGSGVLVAQEYLSELEQDEDLTLPGNVIIIGTVNMDDTTHQFSRKVIDRAMTIEMNGGVLSEMFGHSHDLEYTEEQSQVWTMDKELAILYTNADEVLEVHKEWSNKIVNELPKRLNEINVCLKNTPFEVSYRVLNELVIYLGVLLDNTGGVDEAKFNELVKLAVDNIMLMKILPRVEGDDEMFALSTEEKTNISDSEITNKIEWLKQLAEEKGYTESYRKLEEMNLRLVGGFTRFWP